MHSCWQIHHFLNTAGTRTRNYTKIWRMVEPLWSCLKHSSKLSSLFCLLKGIVTRPAYVHSLLSAICLWWFTMPILSWELLLKRILSVLWWIVFWMTWWSVVQAEGGHLRLMWWTEPPPPPQSRPQTTGDWMRVRIVWRLCSQEILLEGRIGGEAESFQTQDLAVLCWLGGECEEA